MTVLEQVRADIGALIYRWTPRGQLVNSAKLRDLLDRFDAAARHEGSLKPGEVPPLAPDRSAEQLRADLGQAAGLLESAARAVRAMGAGNVDAIALATVLDDEAAGFRKKAA